MSGEWGTGGPVHDRRQRISEDIEFPRQWIETDDAQDAGRAASDGWGTLSDELGDMWAPALRDFRLDDDSAARAVESGRNLANQTDLGRWAYSDHMARLDQLRQAERVVCRDLEIPVSPAMIDFSLEAGKDAGLTTRDHVSLAGWLTTEQSPDQLIVTLAHEYRHQWQLRVIEGEIPHPEGAAGRERLIDGVRSYVAEDADWDMLAYTHNGLETEAEAYARAVGAAFDDAMGKSERTSGESDVS